MILLLWVLTDIWIIFSGFALMSATVILVYRGMKFVFTESYLCFNFTSGDLLLFSNLSWKQISRIVTRTLSYWYIWRNWNFTLFYFQEHKNLLSINKYEANLKKFRTVSDFLVHYISCYIFSSKTRSKYFISIILNQIHIKEMYDWWKEH